ncbi:glutamate racemase [Balneatrix alpica]|uniref:glutamate racemase n=1 Tax=Balneatrix alpica TaxID=75684 RepID=UPI002739C53C|nr:glutamate racemase [Balneatrix alpica]
MESLDTRPIGVFDSGVGGLTVLRALHEQMPNENLLYLGDTARVPYGTKSALSVQRYAEQAVLALLSRRVKAIVVACNTASAAAMDTLRARFTQLPVLGVIEPGAKVGCQMSKSGHLGVIATEGTIQGGAYTRAITQLRQDARVSSVACSLFVALAEEGWVEGDLVEAIIERYLAPLKAAPELDALVLGCTHFPVLKQAIQRVIGERVVLVDSAATAAAECDQLLRQHELRLVTQQQGKIHFMVTDGPERFARVAKVFFPCHLSAEQVEVVDIQHFHPQFEKNEK